MWCSRFFFTKKDGNRFRTLVWKYVHMVKFERKMQPLKPRMETPRCHMPIPED